MQKKTSNEPAEIDLTELNVDDFSIVNNIDIHNGIEQELDDIHQSILNEVNANDNDFNLSTAIQRKPQKLLYFSIRVINAIANSFMGVPAAAIIIAADRILSGTLTAALTTPDKIFILLLASAILMTFLTLAYKSEASTTGIQDLSISIQKLRDIAMILPISKKVYTESIIEAQWEKILQEIYDGQLRETSNNTKIQTVLIEKNTNHINLVLQAIINAEVRFHSIAQQSTNPNELYSALYRILYVPGYTIETTYSEDEKQALSDYQNMYMGINHYIAEDTDAHQNRWELIKKKFEIIVENRIIGKINQQRFREIGSVIGSINAVVNGVLSCVFGIGGITAFMIIFLPGFSIPLAAAIPIGITLFIAGTIHSGTSTKEFITESFAQFGTIIDREKLRHPQKSMRESVDFYLQKIRENSKVLFIAAFASGTVTGLSILATYFFLGNLPIPAPLLVSMVIFVAALTMVSAFNSFNAVLMKKAQADKDKAWYIDNILNKDEKHLYSQAQQAKTNHAIYAAICIAIGLSITVPLMYASFGLLLPLMISASFGMVSYLATAIFDNKSIIQANNTGEKSGLQIFNYRIRLIISIILGVSFAMTSGPTLAKALLSTLPASAATAVMPLTVLFGVMVAASLYYVIPLIYWNIALKPSYRFSIPSNTERHEINHMPSPSSLSITSNQSSYTSVTTSSTDLDPSVIPNAKNDH